MFTGIIEEVGRIQTVIKSTKSAKIIINATKVLQDVNLGDSICTNGVCLTVTEFSKNHFTVDVMAETIRRSNLHQLKPGDEINLERALRVGDRFGGHIVSGHIDGTGMISNFEKEDNAVWVTVKTTSDILRYIVQKGSITIDGISLTVAYVDEQIFKVSIIPHTKDVTTLLKKKVGDIVNLECDMVGKYIEKLLMPREQNIDCNDELNNSKSKIDINFLSENGFI